MSEVNPKRPELARSLDVGELLDPRSTDVAAELKDRTGGIGVDAVIECSGNEIALQTALASVRASGNVSQTGLHTRPAAIDPMVLSERDITLRGTWCYPVTDWPRIIDLIGGVAWTSRRSSAPASTWPTSSRRASRRCFRRQATRSRSLSAPTDHTPSGEPHEGIAFRCRRIPEVDELPIPAIADDEVLVAARSVGVCHSDIELLEGRYIIPFEYPLIPGHEWSGEVMAVGRR